MEKIIDVVKLMAKTGLFFANADGIYSDREKQYITDYISGIELIGDLDPELKQEVKDSLNSKYTLEEIIQQTRDLVDGFEPQEKRAILKAIRTFINQVIRADGRVHPLEQESYMVWKRELSV